MCGIKGLGWGIPPGHQHDSVDVALGKITPDIFHDERTIPLSLVFISDKHLFQVIFISRPPPVNVAQHVTNGISVLLHYKPLKAGSEEQVFQIGIR